MVRTPRLFAVQLAATTVIVVVSAVLLFFGGFSEAGRTVIAGVSFSLASIVMFLACAAAAWRHTGRLRLSWAIFAGAGLMYTAANTWWLAYQIMVGPLPVPSLADAGYLTALTLGAAGLMLYPASDQGLSRWRRFLDGVIVAGALLAAAVSLFLADALAAVRGDAAATIIALIYPLFDVALGTLAILLVAGGATRRRVPVGLLAAGFGAYTVADWIYAYRAAYGNFDYHVVSFVGWTAGYLLVGLAATADRRRTREAEAGRPARFATWTSMLVYAPLLIAAVVDVFAHGAESWSLRSASILLGIVAVSLAVRQALLTVDNERLRGGLENTVQIRTAELEKLAADSDLILSSVDEGIYGIDLQGRVTFVNPAAAMLLGRSADEMLGVDAHETFHRGRVEPDDSDDGACRLFDSVVQGQRVQSSDEWFVRSDGTLFPAEVRSSPTRQRGQITGAVVAFADITERRAVERMKDEFISVVSHELRTPLTAIKGSLGLVAGGAAGALPPQASRMVGLALTSSDRLHRLINDMLDLERIGTGAMPMNMTACSVDALVRQSIIDLQPIAVDAGVRVTYRPSGLRVHADPDRAIQVLVNLIGNALKFSSGGGEVTVTAEQIDHEVTFRVADRGRGIPADKLEQIFGRFQQIDSSDSRDKGGTGLGLAICRTIVERHGGRIWAESTVGEGSTFFFTLPVADRAGDGGRRRSGDDTRVVLVHDDDGAVAPAVATLCRRGLRTVEDAGVDAFIERGVQDVDVAVLDLPPEDAERIAVLRRLSREPALAEATVVVYADPAVAAQARAAFGRRELIVLDRRATDAGEVGDVVASVVGAMSGRDPRDGSGPPDVAGRDGATVARAAPEHAARGSAVRRGK